MQQNDLKDKMKAFVLRLTLNPCFAKETALEIEENILVFFRQNYKALMASFNTPAFFPGVQTTQIELMFSECLTDIINEKLYAEFTKISSNFISYRFLNELYKKEFNSNIYQKVIYSYLEDISKRVEIRRTLTPIIKVLLNRIVDNYVQECFLKRSYAAFEIEKVEKIRLAPASVADYIKIILILSSLGHVRNDLNISLINSIDYQPGELKFPNPVIREKYFQGLIKQYSNSLKNFPPEILQTSTMTHVSVLDDPLIPASSRFARIFYSFGKTYKPGIKIDKGADTFAKSWFQTQRRNYKYYGFDIKLLDEFYRISAENNW